MHSNVQNGFPIISIKDTDRIEVTIHDRQIMSKARNALLNQTASRTTKKLTCQRTLTCHFRTENAFLCMRSMQIITKQRTEHDVEGRNRSFLHEDLIHQLGSWFSIAAQPRNPRLIGNDARNSEVRSISPTFMVDGHRKHTRQPTQFLAGGGIPETRGERCLQAKPIADGVRDSAQREHPRSDTCRICIGLCFPLRPCLADETSQNKVPQKAGPTLHFLLQPLIVQTRQNGAFALRACVDRARSTKRRDVGPNLFRKATGRRPNLTEHRLIVQHPPGLPIASNDGTSSRHSVACNPVDPPVAALTPSVAARKQRPVAFVMRAPTERAD